MDYADSRICGPLELVTPPTSLLAVTLAEAKAHLRIDTTDEDTEVTSLIGEAVEYVEKQTTGHRQLMQATYDLPVSCFWCGRLKLPRPPLSSVSSVKYYNTDDTETTIATTVYLVKTPWRMPGTVELKPDQDWPTDYTSERTFPITIRFVAGYATATVVPNTYKRAIKLLVGHWYRNREGTVPEEIAASVAALCGHEEYGSYA